MDTIGVHLDHAQDSMRLLRQGFDGDKPREDKMDTLNATQRDLVRVAKCAKNAKNVKICKMCIKGLSRKQMQKMCTKNNKKSRSEGKSQKRGKWETIEEKYGQNFQ